MGARASGARGSMAAKARARAKKTTSPRTSLSLLPQPPSSASTDAPQPMFFRHLDAVMGSVRSRGRGFSRRAGCPLDVSRLLLASAGPAEPSSAAPGNRATRGSPGWGGKTLRRFPTSAAATVSWEEIMWLLLGPKAHRALAFCKTLAPVLVLPQPA